MINQLTEVQKLQLDLYRDRWLKIGLSTEPANRGLAEKHLRDAYKMAGLEPPEQIIWVTSPLAGALTAGLLKDEAFLEKLKKDIKGYNPQKIGASVRASVRDSVGASVGDSVRASVGDSVWDSVRASVRDSVWASVGDSVRASVGDSVWASVGDSVRASVGDSVRASVWDSVWDSVRASVRASVRDSVWASVGDSVGASVRDSVRDSVWDSVGASVRDSVGASVRWDALYGQQDAHWLGFYDFFREVCKLEDETNKLLPLIELAKHSNWIYPYKNIAFMSEKPNICSLNDNGVIHSLDGPAIAYSDGFSIFALDGVRVTEEIIDNCRERKDPTKVLALENAEQRLVAIKNFGVENLLKPLNAKTIDTKVSKSEIVDLGFKTIEVNKYNKVAWGDKVKETSLEYELIELTLEGAQEKLLKMKNASEEKWHYEFVPPEIKQVTEALAWRMGWKEFEEPKFKA